MSHPQCFAVPFVYIVCNRLSSPGRSYVGQRACLAGRVHAGRLFRGKLMWSAHFQCSSWRDGCWGASCQLWFIFRSLSNSKVPKMFLIKISKLERRKRGWEEVGTALVASQTQLRFLLWEIDGWEWRRDAEESQLHSRQVGMSWTQRWRNGIIFPVNAVIKKVLGSYSERVTAHKKIYWLSAFTRKIFTNIDLAGYPFLTDFNSCRFVSF